jgi:cell division protein FtsB
MARARSAERSRVGVWAERVLWVAAAGVLVWIALGDGEYSTLELLRQVAVRDSVAGQVAVLEAQRDSLARALAAVRTDPWRLEQLAREEHGMVRGDKELLYRLSRGGGDRVDSGRAGPDIP